MLHLLETFSSPFGDNADTDVRAPGIYESFHDAFQNYATTTFVCESDDTLDARFRRDGVSLL